METKNQGNTGNTGSTGNTGNTPKGNVMDSLKYEDLLVDTVRNAKGLLPRGANPYAGTPFEWLTALPPNTKSSMAARILARVLTDGTGIPAYVSEEAERTLYLGANPDGTVGTRGIVGTVGTQADDGSQVYPVTVKFSMAPADNGLLTFQQVRNVGLQPIACFGLTPSKQYLWLVPSALLHDIAKDQHGGPEERWIAFSPTQVPQALQAFGGTFPEGIQQFIQRYGHLAQRVTAGVQSQGSQGTGSSGASQRSGR